jgi:polysaccharide deacetylase family protein (PEP-CTERM system associated)
MLMDWRSGHQPDDGRRWPTSRRAETLRQAEDGFPTCVLTFDIEEWFQVENLRSAFPRAHWEHLPRRAARATQLVLELLAAHDVRATFFVLGWVAERNPGLVRSIAAAGHEIACHGYGHVLPMQLTDSEFLDDIVKGRHVLQQIIGEDVVGYRAPSFNVDDGHLAALAKCGFRYDSSFHPFGLHPRYGRLNDLGRQLGSGVYQINGFVELAMPVERLARAAIPIGGGGYFRVCPPRLFRRLVRRFILRNRHYLMYLHSWEFDPDQPRIGTCGFGPRFRHYHNLDRTYPRLRAMIRMLQRLNSRFLTAREFVSEIAAHAST